MREGSRTTPLASAILSRLECLSKWATERNLCGETRENEGRPRPPVGARLSTDQRLALCGSIWMWLTRSSMPSVLLPEHDPDAGCLKSILELKSAPLQTCSVSVRTCSSNTRLYFLAWKRFPPVALLNGKCSLNQISIVDSSATFPKFFTAPVLLGPKRKGRARRSSSIFSAFVL